MLAGLLKNLALNSLLAELQNWGQAKGPITNYQKPSISHILQMFSSWYKQPIYQVASNKRNIQSSFHKQKNGSTEQLLSVILRY